jgi:hypothetical protein
LSLFFYFNLSSPSGIATCTALHAINNNNNNNLYFPSATIARLRRMMITDSAGNIAAGALIQANTLNYFIFPDFFFCSQRDS